MENRNGMRITMVGSLPPIKGMSAYCLQQVQALSRLVDIDFVSFKSIYPRLLYPIDPTEKDNVFQVNVGSNVRIQERLRWYDPLGSALSGLKARTSVVHLHWWTSFLFLAFYPFLLATRLRGKKIVCTVHNVLGHESNLLDSILCRLILALPDKYIVHSAKNKEQLKTTFGIDPDDVEVIPHGRYDFYIDERVDKAEARRALGISQKSKVVLFFGHVRSYKGVDTLLEAMAEVCKEVSDATCIIAGKPWTDWEPCQRIIDQNGLNGNVKLELDYVPSSRVKFLYSAADVVVLPYRHFDSQSGPGNIALAFGKALAVSRVGGLPDLVRDEGAIFPAGDNRELARILVKVLSDGSYRRKLEEDAGEVARLHDWDVIAERTAGLYRTLLNGASDASGSPPLRAPSPVENVSRDPVS
jgi:glycosyltransferase involved in cell wall biosynthesis